MSDEIRVSGPFVNPEPSNYGDEYLYRYDACAIKGGLCVQAGVVFPAPSKEIPWNTFIKGATIVLKEHMGEPLVPWPYPLPPKPDCPFFTVDAVSHE